MCAAALPGENGTHEIRVEMNQKRQKNVPDIIDCNSKKDDRIVIIFGTGITDTTGHQMTVRVTTSPNVCFCTSLPAKKQNKRNCVKIKNVSKFYLSGSVASNSPDLSPCVMQQLVYRTLFRNVDELKVTG